jgi:hypothetical protein
MTRPQSYDVGSDRFDPVSFPNNPCLRKVTSRESPLAPTPGPRLPTSRSLCELGGKCRRSWINSAKAVRCDRFRGCCSIGSGLAISSVGVACGLPDAGSCNNDYLRSPASRMSPKARQSFRVFHDNALRRGCTSFDKRRKMSRVLPGVRQSHSHL